jgi:hypothetical protein
MLVGQGRLIVQGDVDRPSRAFIYLPVEVARDSQFPFKEGNCQVQVEVDLQTKGLLISAATDPK